MNKEIDKIIDDIWTESEYRFDKKNATERIEQSIKNLLSQQFVERLDKFIKSAFNESLEREFRELIRRLLTGKEAFQPKLEKLLNKELDENWVPSEIREPNDLLRFICKEYCADVESVKGPIRSADLVKVRRIYCYIASQLWLYTRRKKRSKLVAIGVEINVTHATVLHHIRKCEGEIRLYLTVETEMTDLLNRVKKILK